MQASDDKYLKQLSERYLTVKPSKKLKVLDIEIPCDTECLKNTEFKELLANDTFREEVEIIDSIEDLINNKIAELLEELRYRFMNYNLNYNNLAYSIFKIVEYGGNVVIGEKLSYEGRVISSENYEKIYEISKKIDQVIWDQNIKSICDEIRHLSESLWIHFDKNLRRILNEI